MGATRAVIFDFDYTPADSSGGIVECIDYALAGMGLACATRDAACRTIGLTLQETFIKLAGRNGPRAAVSLRASSRGGAAGPSRCSTASRNCPASSAAKYNFLEL